MDTDELTYGSYLRVPELLALQRPRSRPPHPEELHFIVVHQALELWLKLLLHDLGRIVEFLDADDHPRSLALLGRVNHTLSHALEQMRSLHTLAPWDLHQFRSYLGTASGSQSVQFRELEFVSGAKDPAYLRRFRGLTAAEQERLQRRLAEPSLWDAFIAVLTDAGFKVDTPEDRVVALREVAYDRARYGAIWDLAEALVEHDALFARWRARHVLMVERQIGTKSGTGGSSGAPYLRNRLDLRFYPELWELRSQL